MDHCPITGEAAEIRPAPDSQFVDCARTDGPYEITGSASAVLSPLTMRERLRLVTWIVDQRRLGEGYPRVTSEIVEGVRASRRMRTAVRRDRFFLAMMKAEPSPGFRFGLGEAVSGGRGTYTDRLCAWLECDPRDLSQFIKGLSDDGYLRLVDGLGKIFFTPKGLERMEALEGANPDSHQAFVAMWFDPQMDDAASAIQEAVRDAGYEPLIISNKEHNGDINDAIMSEIRRSRFVVADFTCGIATPAVGAPQGVPRGGVYFEAGFARGLGIEVIWSCRDDCMSYVHFDTNHIAHVVWKDPADLRERLTRRIGAVLGYTAKARVAPPAGRLGATR